MFIDRLLNQGSAPSLEQWLKFTDQRQRLLGEDIVNASTPGYLQKDLSLGDFQKQLAHLQQQNMQGAVGSTDFNSISIDIERPKNGILFHDGNNRSMEQLMTDQAKNALMHNMAVELLRKQYSLLDMALKERVG